MAGWLGQQGYSREAMSNLNDAYKAMYPSPKEQVQENVELEEYSVSEANHVAIMEGKKKCKDGYYYCSDEKKCKKEKTKTMAHGYGGGANDDDNDGEGGDGGGDGGGGGGE